MTVLRRLRILLATSCATATLATQHDADAGRRGAATPAPAAPTVSRVALHEAGSGTGSTRPDETGTAGAGPKRDTPGRDAGIAVQPPPHAQCAFEVSVSPPKLMAGQTGTARIVMILQADSVLESTDDLRIAAVDGRDAGASMLALGPAAMRPPRRAAQAAFYQGREVFDDWALVELPVTMSATAPPGSRQTIEVDARFALHEGSTGRLFGEFENRLSIACEVAATADPAAPPRSSTAGGGDGAASVAPASPGAPAQPLRPTPIENPLEVRPAGTGSDGRDHTPRAPAPDDDVPPPPTAADPLLPILVAGSVFAIAALLLLRRRR